MTTHQPGDDEANAFCWMDLKTRDLPGTAAFFSKTLGWHFAVDEEDWRQTTAIAVDGHRIGGVSDLAQPVYPPGTPAHIAYYLAVDDVDRRTEAATARGARLVVPPFDAGDQGRMATLIDPVGAAFSLWQPYRFSGWGFPPRTAGAPHRMVLGTRRRRRGPGRRPRAHPRPRPGRRHRVGRDRSPRREGERPGGAERPCPPPGPMNGRGGASVNRWCAAPRRPR
ncbi:VOC family protein [Streptomyces botrytidirepellens]|uniref:VOC family protein n=1 Tax=Streptomyces botrytidirepellens TaxID=2486417 RepID=UPI001FE84CFB|nr:VOC family protein [Streptomyces botrytidirepellens]